MSEENAKMGQVLRDGERLGLCFERRLRHPPEKVWRALTESEHLRHWMPCDMIGERKAGARLELVFWPPFVDKYQIEEPTLHGDIRVWDPPRVFEWTWGGDLLRFELQATAEGTLLIFTTWLESAEPKGAADTASGYHACLDSLVELLDTGMVREPLLDAPTGPWEARYAAAVNRALA